VQGAYTATRACAHLTVRLQHASRDVIINPGGFGTLVNYPALVLHYSGVLLLLLRFCA
jgi:hypothetical protein